MGMQLKMSLIDQELRVTISTNINIRSPVPSTMFSLHGNDCNLYNNPMTQVLLTQFY